MSASVILPDWSFSLQLLELLGGLLEVALGQVLGEVRGGARAGHLLELLQLPVDLLGRAELLLAILHGVGQLVELDQGLVLLGGGGLREGLGRLLDLGEELVGLGELGLVELLALAGDLLAEGLGLLGDHALLDRLGGLGLGPAWTSSGTKSIATARAPGMSGNHASRGSLGPNAEPTSSTDTWRTASAIRARPASLSRKASGSVRAVLSRSLRWNA